MTIDELFEDKTIKPKEKTEALSKLLTEGFVTTDELLDYADKQRDSSKATCIEALEYATKKNPEIADETVMAFVTGTLTAKAPRIKWESAKVTGNIAHRFPGMLEAAIRNLLENTEHEGTVVRWSAAYALGEIIKAKTEHNTYLLPAIGQICEKEEKNSIRKIYLDAIKKSK